MRALSQKIRQVWVLMVASRQGLENAMFEHWPHHNDNRKAGKAKSLMSSQEVHTSLEQH
jgi:hypothetical protein